MYNLYYHHQSNYRITSLRHVNGTFQRVDKLLCLQTLVISPPLLHRQGQEPIICLAAVKKTPALSSDKVREHSVHPDLFWKLGLAKLHGSGLLQAEEFPGHLLLLLIRDQAGEEGKQDQGAAEILVVVLQQSFLSQNFIYRLGTYQFECLGSLNL